MAVSILFIAVGLALLYFGAEGLVRGASGLALRLGVTPLVVGLTVVAFGTSAPELVVSLKSAVSGNGGISIGNVVGSNICNIALILGLAAVIRPLSIEIDIIRLQVPIMIAATVALIVMLIGGVIGRVEGLILLAGFAAFLAFNLLRSKNSNAPQTAENSVPAGRLSFSILMISAGLVFLVFGAELFVRGAVQLARILHVSDTVIGLTVVAFGTSLPELATSVVAALKGEADIATGNVIGSNIFNILAILGISSIVRPIGSTEISLVTLAVLAITSIISLPLFRTGFTLSRIEGAFFLIIYAGYICWLAVYGTV